MSRVQVPKARPGRIARTAAAMFALFLVATACGGDDASDATVATTVMAETTTTTAAPPTTEDHEHEEEHEEHEEEHEDDHHEHEEDHEEDEEEHEDDHHEHEDEHADHDHEDDDHADEAMADQPRTVEDATGEMVTLEAPAVRVVCLTGLCVDTMFVLGIKPVAANDLLHRDPAYWGPDENEIGPVSGSFFEPSLEDIAAGEPDIVIGLGGVHDGLRAALESIAPLFIVNPVGVEGMLAHVIEVGILLGMEHEAEDAVAAFEARLEQYVAGVTTKRSVMVVYGSDVNIGAETVCTPAIDALAHATAYPPEFTSCDVHNPFVSFSVEQLLAVDPDVIFVQTYGFGPTPPEPVSEQLVDNVIWRELVAVQNGEVHEVDFFIWGTSRGINGTNFVLDEAMPKIYPEAFPAPLP